MEMTDMMEDSLDGGPPSVGSGEMLIGHCNSMSGTVTAPVSAKKVLMFGYSDISFSVEVFSCCLFPISFWRSVDT